MTSVLSYFNIFVLLESQCTWDSEWHSHHAESRCSSAVVPSCTSMEGRTAQNNKPNHDTTDHWSLVELPKVLFSFILHSYLYLGSYFGKTKSTTRRGIILRTTKKKDSDETRQQQLIVTRISLSLCCRCHLVAFVTHINPNERS